MEKKIEILGLDFLMVIEIWIIVVVIMSPMVRKIGIEKDIAIINYH